MQSPIFPLKSIKDFSKNISKFEDEAKVLLNRTDYGVEKSYHMQESKSDEALNLYRVFKDQINYFRISGKIGDCKKINNIKLQSGAKFGWCYSTTITICKIFKLA